MTGTRPILTALALRDEGYDGPLTILGEKLLAGMHAAPSPPNGQQSQG